MRTESLHLAKLTRADLLTIDKTRWHRTAHWTRR
jgi:hypothetical protein